jgi:hypothetical protein
MFEEALLNAMFKHAGIEHFKAKEFWKEGFPPPVAILSHILPVAMILDEARDNFGVIRVTSGYRTRAHNDRVGGAEKSQHLFFTAADVQPAEVSVRELNEWFNREHGTRLSIGTYSTFVHIDTRTAAGMPREGQAPSRWHG